jgi:hypothetical protein
MYQSRPAKGFYVARTVSTVSSSRNDIALVSSCMTTEEKARGLLPVFRKNASKSSQRADWFVIQVLG